MTGASRPNSDTGPASLYRYLASRDDLLDLMADSVASEFELVFRNGDWLANLLDVGRQARERSCCVTDGCPVWSLAGERSAPAEPTYWNTCSACSPINLRTGLRKSRRSQC